ncbi:MAG TPA: ATP-dependent Clp protease ATP-binding subunit ClpA, partial [Thiothrix sp.]|nr:ATP-dependent Clp protease ATP-binding subunit ClpA [Thiothrix sp.]
MLSAEVEFSISQLFKDARERRFEFVTVEHLLLILTENPSAAEAMRASGLDIPLLQYELEAFIEENTPVLPEGDQRDVQPTLGFQRVIQRAVYSAQANSKGEVNGDAVLVAIFAEQDSHAVYFMSRQEVERLDVVNYIAHGVRKDSEDDLEIDDLLEEENDDHEAPEVDENQDDSNAKPLDK